MSVVASFCRAGPSQRNALTRVLISKEPSEAVRHMSKGSGVAQTAGYLKKDKQPRQRKKIAPPKPMSEAQRTQLGIQTPPTSVKTIAFDATALPKEGLFQPTVFGTKQTDPLRIFGTPNRLQQELHLLSKPTNVVRKATVETFQRLDSWKETSSASSRVVFSGPSGSGKTFLLLQSVEYALRSGWVVIYIPRGEQLVNSTTPYAYDIRTRTYLQHAFAFQTLQRTLSVNRKALSSIPLIEDIVLEKSTISAGANLVEVIDTVIKDRVRTSTQAALILETVMKSLDKQTAFPVLFAVDQLQALYGKSRYRDPHFNEILSYHLSMPRLILDYASGKRVFNRGAFLSAVSLSNTQFPVGLELKESLGLPHSRPITPFEPRSKNLKEYMNGLEVFNVPEKLTLEEAATLFEIWKGKGLLVGETYDETFVSKYTESGGNPRDFVWKGLLGSIAA